MEMKLLLLLLLIFLVSVFLLFRGKKYSGRLPPGSLGIPLIGQSFTLLKALKADNVEGWIRNGIAKHGSIWKTTLFGYPTVVLNGTHANKFVYTSDSSILTTAQPPSTGKILGPKNILELMGDDHKRVRSALLSFLKVEVLKQYVPQVDEEIRKHLEMHWHGKNMVKVQSLIKILTFNVICSLLVGIETGPKRDRLLPLFQDMMVSVLSFPVNLPFTKYSRGLKARKKLVTLLADILREKKEALEKQKQEANPHKDLITSLLNIHDDDASKKLSDEEIIDSIIFVMIAGYDTTTILISLVVRLLTKDKSIYSNMVQEHKEIARTKTFGEALVWEDLTKMKYTWRVASELLRINPPVNISFRRAAQDIEYQGWTIPKGWQVMVSASMTQTDDNIFQNPTMVDPTRLEKHAPLPPAFSLVAFGAGPRTCPGMELAKMETLAMVHHLVTKFEWELVNKDESFKRFPLPEFDQGLSVRITPIKPTLMSSNISM